MPARLSADVIVVFDLTGGSCPPATSFATTAFNLPAARGFVERSSSFSSWMCSSVHARDRPLRASVAAAKIARRAGAAKDSRKLDAASAGDQLDIVELLRTPSGTTRAQTSDGGRVTATTNEIGRAHV